MRQITIEQRVERGLQLVTISSLLLVVIGYLALPLPDIQRLVVIMAVILVAAGLLSTYLLSDTEVAPTGRGMNGLVMLVATVAIVWAAQPYSLLFVWLFFIYMMIVAWRTSRGQWATLTLLGGVGLVAIASTIDLNVSSSERWLGFIMLIAGLLAVAILARVMAEAFLVGEQSRRHLTSLVHQHRQADEDKTEILSLVTHQLKTPLALIRWSTESVLNNKHLTDKEHERLDQTIATTHVMYRTIEDLSHVFKLTSTGQYLRPEPVVLDELIKSILTEYQGIATQRQIKIIYQPNRTPVKLKADKIMLKHALANLIDNAVKYSFDGDKVELAVKRERDMISISVTDHGIGIEPANIERIGQRFFRADRARHHNETGTGLGLYLVTIIVHKMRGHLTITSEIGKGSTFTISIPAMAEEGPTEPTSTGAA